MQSAAAGQGAGSGEVSCCPNSAVCNVMGILTEYCMRFQHPYLSQIEQDACCCVTHSGTGHA